MKKLKNKRNSLHKRKGRQKLYQVYKKKSSSISIYIIDKLITHHLEQNLIFDKQTLKRLNHLYL